MDLLNLTNSIDFMTEDYLHMYSISVGVNGRMRGLLLSLDEYPMISEMIFFILDLKYKKEITGSRLHSDDLLSLLLKVMFIDLKMTAFVKNTK